MHPEAGPSVNSEAGPSSAPHQDADMQDAAAPPPPDDAPQVLPGICQWELGIAVSPYYPSRIGHFWIKLESFPKKLTGNVN